ncbi:DUF4197 domain-containing protein [Capnocytophaga canimorsus]|uniref:DUF4197 domain-containing protein n=1 Tax=Capnocytophaga canimorsus TaxID=28188 RepID=UPI0037CDCF53
MKRITIALSGFLFLSSCAELQGVINNYPSSEQTTGKTLSSLDISNGLKQALEFGIVSGVDVLSQKDGYYTNQLVKILLPQELREVDQVLRSIGLGSLADEGLKLLNRAAEQAVSEAKPIFISAVKNLTFADAASILAGNDDAATQYLKRHTTQQLVVAFSPKIKASLDQVGANDIWRQIINKYNSIPFVDAVNPDLTQYVTEQAINGLFIQIAQKERDIRTKISQRTTPLLQKVFSNQN